MRHWTVKIPLPPGWEAIPGESRAYRRKGAGGGWLRRSLYPPQPDLNAGEDVLGRLQELLAEANLDVGEELHSAHSNTPFGPSATSLRKSSERGLSQFWLVAGKVTVFASDEMGSLDAVQQDLAEAHQAIGSLELKAVP